MSSSRADILRTRLIRGRGSAPTAPAPSTDAFADLFENRPRNEQEWKRFLEDGLGKLMGAEHIVMPDVALTEGHTSLLKLSFKIFCVAQGRHWDGSDRLLNEEEMIEVERQHLTEWLLHGARGGSKTFMVAAIIMALCIFVPGYGAIHCAAENQQSERVIKYLKGWIEAKGSPIAKMVKGKPLKTKIEFVNDSAIHLTTGSTKTGVNSAHVPWLSYDEVELADFSIIEEAMGIPQAQVGRNLPAMVVLLSTQKEAGLTMSDLIKRTQGKDSDLSYAKWNWLEVVERCPDARTRKLPQGLVCADYKQLLKRRTELEMIDVLSRDKQSEMSLIQRKIERLTDNCRLVEFCQGKAKLGEGYMTIGTVLMRLRRMGRPKFLAQMQCARPSPENAVYPEFGDENFDLRARAALNAPTIGIIDPGYAVDPVAIILMCAHDGFIDVFYEEETWERMSTPRIVARAKQLTQDFNVDEWVVDNQAAELCDTMIEDDLYCERAPKRPIEEGVDKVTIALNDQGFRRLRFNPLSCPRTIECMYNYKRKNGKIPRQPKVDHLPDCVRYGVQKLIDALYGGGGVQMSPGQPIHKSG